MTKFRNSTKFRRDDRGAIAIYAAATLPIVVGCMALAVDMGAIYLERRTAQGIVDLAAVNAAEFPDTAEAAARSTLGANGLDNVKSLSVLKGNYRPDTSLPPHARFQTGVEPFNAVRVELAKDARIAFSASFVQRAPEFSVSATAAITNAATFSVGSRLAAVRGGLLNDTLGALTGTRIDLSVMDYEALIDAKVRIDDFLNALSADLRLTGVTYDKVLDTSITLKALANALRVAAKPDASSAAIGALDLLAGQLPAAGAKLKLRSLLDLGSLASLQSGPSHPGLAATIGVLDFLRTSALLANGGHQVSVDLKLQIPGVTRTILTLAIGEPMQRSAWASVGQPGSMVRTAQLKLRIVSEIGGKGALAGLTIRLPLYVESAYADARLADVQCTAGVADSATVAVAPGIVRAAIADVPDAMLAQPDLWQQLPSARLLQSPVAVVEGRADIRAGNTSPTQLTFTKKDVDASTTMRVDTDAYLASLATSLLGNLSVSVRALGLALAVPSTLGATVVSQVQPVAAPLDAALHSVLEILGVHLGEADVKVHAIGCGGAALID